MCYEQRTRLVASGTVVGNTSVADYEENVIGYRWSYREAHTPTVILAPGPIKSMESFTGAMPSKLMSSVINIGRPDSL